MPARGLSDSQVSTTSRSADNARESPVPFGRERDVCLWSSGPFGKPDADVRIAAAADDQSAAVAFQSVEPAGRGENTEAASVIPDDEGFPRVIRCGKLEIEPDSFGFGRVGMIQDSEDLLRIEFDAFGTGGRRAAECGVQCISFFRSGLQVGLGRSSDPA